MPEAALRTARVLRAHVGRYVQQWFAFRFFPVTLVVGQAITPLTGLALWTVALPGRKLSTYFVALLFVRLVTASYEQHTFSGSVWDGGIVDLLLRPHAVVLSPLAENLAIRFVHAAIGMPLLVVVGAVTSIRLDAGDLALAVPAIVLAGAIQFAYTFSLALTAFWTGRAFAVTDLGLTLVFLLGGEAAPTFLFPAAVRRWLELLPFRAMRGFPAEIAAGITTGERLVAGYAAQAFWLVALSGVAALVWRAGVRRYTAVGG